MLPNDLQTQFLGVFDEELVKKVTNLAMKIIPDQISMKDISQIADLTEIEHSTRISIGRQWRHFGDIFWAVVNSDVSSVKTAEL